MSLENNGTSFLIQKPGLVVLIFVACFSFWLADFWKPINVYNSESIFQSKAVFHYYSYLPAVFMNNNSFDFKYEKNEITVSEKYKKRLPMYYSGQAMLYAPFFALACLRCYFSNIDTEKGFAPIFASYIHWGALFYVWLGLVFLYSLLRGYFKEYVTAIVLFVVLFATTLFYYTYTQSELPQASIFFLFAAFLYTTQKWYDKPRYFLSFLGGVILGIISLIYFFELYIGLFFIFWNIKQMGGIKSRMLFLKQNYTHLLVMLLTAALIWTPQLIFNLYLTGRGFFIHFPGELFNFLNAEKGYFLLFSYCHGWLTYCPILILALVGIYYSDDHLVISKSLLVLVFILVVVAYGSLENFEQDGYYGSRRLTPAIVWLCFPMAAAVNRFFNVASGSVLKALLVLFLFSCVCLNLGQTYLVINKRIEANTMDADKYWILFRSFKFPE